MPCYLKTLLPAAVLTLGLGIGHGLADEQEAGNIEWSVDDNYNGTNQTACVVENYNDFTVDAVFHIFPADFDVDGNPMPNRAVITMKPYVQYKLYSWANSAGPGPQCALLTYSVRPQ